MLYTLFIIMGESKKEEGKAWVIGIVGFCIIVIAGWCIDCYLGFSSQYGSLPEGSYFNQNGTVGAIIALFFAGIFLSCVWMDKEEIGK